MLTVESLFDRIGGEYTINNVVDPFYEKVLSDDLLNPFFEGVCMNSQMAKMKIFLKAAFGGVSSGTIKNMKKAHVHLVARGLSDKHIDRMIHHMKKSLMEVGVNSSLTQEAVDVVDSYRDEVLGR